MLHDQDRSSGGRRIATDHLWNVTEFICNAGPGDRPFEERHQDFTIAAVIAGTFRCRTDSGSGQLHSGSFMLGNAGSCYECSHDHGTGDRCISFHYAPDYFAEISAVAAGSASFVFPTAMLPSSRQLTATTAAVERANLGFDIEETAVALAETVIAAVSGHAAHSQHVHSRDARRIGHVLNYIETHACQHIDLNDLAAQANMSKYHFLRCFRKVVGMTPHQFVLSLRMRRAAFRLTATSESVVSIAMDCGFGDLSTFNQHFGKFFGKSPSQLRRLGKGP
jgi:AraC family transcriptional regulator